MERKQKGAHMKNSIFPFLGAFICCFLWGSAFPGIKIGYELWDIRSEETWRILRFAGTRFFLAGVLVILFGSLIKRKLLLPAKDELPKILLLSFFQTIGQYVFFYVGLAHTTGVNSAVVDSLTTFFAILIASVVMKMETLSIRKMLGCVIGFAGVLLINLTPEGFSFKPLGDGLIVLSALCYGVSSSLIKKYSSDHDTVLFSGYQFAIGGLVMVMIGWVGLSVSGEGTIKAGEHMGTAVLTLIYLALVSSVAYTLWGILLKTNDVSKISIFGFMTPVIGVILSALLLGESDTIGVKHILSLLLVVTGIVTVNVVDKS